MIIRLFLVFCLFGLVLVPSGAFAVGDSFTVSFRMSNDTTPPSIPDPVTAIPVATTQIDVSWGASTDNDILSGYKVFRNGTQIATTTLTAYSDGGLTPSTTYSYYIQAFDDTLNVSTSSVVVATTTLAVPITPPGGNASSSGSQSTRIATQVSNLVIDTAATSATLSWHTNTYTRFVLRWGRTSAYELGSVQSEVYRRDNVTRITDLEPGTQYEFQIIAYSYSGRPIILAARSFTTQAVSGAHISENVANLSAVEEGNGVLLTWQNPALTDFSRVRIVRNYRFYPTDPADGFIAYEGRGETYSDAEAFLQSPLQYYTVFTYDTAGNVSSGAVVTITAAGAPPLPTASVPGGQGSGGTPKPLASSTISIPVESHIPSLAGSLVFSDLQFTQANTRLPIIDGRVTATSTFPLRIALPYELLPEHLKSILVTLSNETKGEQSYLLRINKDKSAYEAEISVVTPGTYQVHVLVYDFETKVQEKIQGTLIVVPGKKEPASISHFLPTSFMSWLTGMRNWWWLIPLLIMCIIRYLVRERLS